MCVRFRAWQNRNISFIESCLRHSYYEVRVEILRQLQKKLKEEELKEILHEIRNLMLRHLVSESHSNASLVITSFFEIPFR